MKFSTTILFFLSLASSVDSANLRHQGQHERSLQQIAAEAEAAVHEAQKCAATAEAEAEVAVEAEKEAEIEAKKAKAEVTQTEKEAAAKAAQAAETAAKEAAEVAKRMAILAEEARAKAEAAYKMAEETGDSDAMEAAHLAAQEAEQATLDAEAAAEVAEKAAARSAQLALAAKVAAGIDISSGGGAVGDPHIKTWKGTRFDFHGECDLVLIKSAIFGGGRGLDLHIRTQMRRNWSFITSAILKIGDETLEVESEGVYYLNGASGAPMPSAIAGFPITHTLSKKGRLAIDVHLGNSGHIHFREYKEFVSVSIANGDKTNFGDSLGLMGSFETGHMVARDGKTIVEDPNAFGLEWQVRESEPMLFRAIRAPQFPQVCKLPSAKEIGRRRRLLEDETFISRDEAENACADWGADIELCVYDVMSTGDLGMADAGAF